MRMLQRLRKIRDVTAEHDAAVVQVRAKARAEASEFTAERRGLLSQERDEAVRWEWFGAAWQWLATLATPILLPQVFAAVWHVWPEWVRVLALGEVAIATISMARGGVATLQRAWRWQCDLASWWEDEAERRFDLYGHCMMFLERRRQALADLDQGTDRW